MSGDEENVVDLTSQVQDDPRSVVARLTALYRQSKEQDDGRRVRRRNLEIGGPDEN